MIDTTAVEVWKICRQACIYSNPPAWPFPRISRSPPSSPAPRRYHSNRGFVWRQRVDVSTTYIARFLLSEVFRLGCGPGSHPSRSYASRKRRRSALPDRLSSSAMSSGKGGVLASYGARWDMSVLASDAILALAADSRPLPLTGPTSTFRAQRFDNSFRSSSSSESVKSPPS